MNEVVALHPFHEGRDLWPVGSHYRYHREGHELIRVVRGVKDGHVAAVGGGAVELALLADGPLIVVCSRFGDALPWAGGAFHWHRVPRLERAWPPSEPEPGAGGVMEIHLVEARDGRARAARYVTLSPRFTRVLNDAILEQARFNYDPGEERRALATLLRRCLRIEALVAFSTVRTSAG